MQMLETEPDKVRKLKKTFHINMQNFNTMLSPECREYSKYVYVNDESGPAMFVVPTSKKEEKVAKCGIVETTLIVGGVKVNNELEFPHMVSFMSLTFD